MATVVWEDLVVSEGQVRTFVQNNDNYFSAACLVGGDGSNAADEEPSVINYGEIYLENTINYNGVLFIFTGMLNWSSGVVENHGLISCVLPENYGVTALSAINFGPDLHNDGRIVVQAKYTAYAYTASHSNIRNTGAGTIEVASTEIAKAIISAYGGAYLNDGEILAHSTGGGRTGYAQGANGISIGNGGGSIFQFSIDNSGLIEATDQDPTTAWSAAILLWGDGLGSIVNTGIIRGSDYAIWEKWDGSFASQPLDITIQNSGTIEGHVALDLGNDYIRNTGQIIGDVRLGLNDDTYNGAGGTVTGKVSGEAGNDTLIGDSKADRFDGGAGDDYLDGGGGADQLFGGLGDDIFVVDQTGDIVTETPSEGVDEVRTSVGYTLGANLENLRLTGLAAIAGTGNELANTIRGNEAANVLAGLDGWDKLYGYGGDDTLDGGNGDDNLYGLMGNDTLTGGSGYDRMYGGVGDDLYYANDATDYAYENAGEGHDTVIASLDHQLRAEVEDLQLTGSALIGKGNEGDNGITGTTGANRLYGYEGNDTLDGGAGDDYLIGAEGNDILTGGAGYDRMYGGTGDDTYFVNDASDYAYENVGEGNDRVVATINHQLRANIEVLELAGSADLRGYGNTLDNQIIGNSVANLLYGRDGNDSLFGNGGNDILYGENGDDALDGGAGFDRFYGGTGADDFIFENGDFAGLTSSTADRIHDFNQGQGDVIRLDGVDADSGLGGNQAFAFIGSGAFTGVAGQLRYQQISGNTYVQGDTNGDGLADFWIRLDGLHTLGGGDFGL